jgi:hypothetical protein
MGGSRLFLVRICSSGGVCKWSFRITTTLSSGKRAGADKKLSKVLEQQYVEEAALPDGLPAVSPIGSLAEASTRKLMIDLISTMNASFPDYDFRYA